MAFTRSRPSHKNDNARVEPEDLDACEATGGLRTLGGTRPGGALERARCAGMRVASTKRDTERVSFHWSQFVQGDGRRLMRVHACPQGWDIEFKLDSPATTTLKCLLCKGVVERLRVAPEGRSNDLEMPRDHQPKEPFE